MKSEQPRKARDRVTFADGQVIKVWPTISLRVEYLWDPVLPDIFGWEIRIFFVGFKECFGSGQNFAPGLI